MENLKSFLNHYFWLIFLIGLTAFGAIVYHFGGIYQEHRTDGEIRQTEIQANTAIRESINAEKRADDSAVERSTEDAIRQQTITPKLETARRKSADSKAELKRLNHQYQNEKLHPQNLDSTDADNCRKLILLFPDTKFADCR